jgi:hypothetical protein
MGKCGYRECLHPLAIKPDGNRARFCVAHLAHKREAQRRYEQHGPDIRPAFTPDPVGDLIEELSYEV